MGNEVKVAKIHKGKNIFFSNFMGLYFVLWDKGDGTSSCNRFYEIEQAEKFIEQKLEERQAQLSIPWYLRESGAMA